MVSLSTCSKYQSRYSKSDLIGQWMWIYENDKSLPSQEISAGRFGTDDSFDYTWIEDNQWKGDNAGHFYLKNDALYISDRQYAYNITYVDGKMLIFKDSFGVEWGAVKIYSEENDTLFGTWECDTMSITFNKNETYKCTYSGNSPHSGVYGIYNDYLWYQSDTGAGIKKFRFINSENGLQMKETIVNEDGTEEIRLLHKVQ